MTGQSGPQLVPEARIRPLLELLIQSALDVVPTARVGAHTAEREAALMVGIQQFARCGRHVGEYSQPSEGVHSLIMFHGCGGYALPAHAVRTVATGYEITLELACLTFM